MTTKSKALGNALEHQVVEKAKSKGMRARRQPLSGVLAEFPNDVEVEDWLLVECKVRAAKTNAKGKKTFTVELDWLKNVTSHVEGRYDMGVVVFRAKGSSEMYVLANLDAFLALAGGHKRLDEVA